MKAIKYILFLISISFFSCDVVVKNENTATSETLKNQIEITLNNWHKAAANANFDTYFNLMTHDGVFIGTDATENWQLDAFKVFSKPYFDKGKAWNFTAIERNVYFSEDRETAWFDELLDTQMKLCRGSGVLKYENDSWKIAHYVLSIAIPNSNVTQVVELKKEFDSILTQKIILKKQ